MFVSVGVAFNDMEDDPKIEERRPTSSNISRWYWVSDCTPAEFVMQWGLHSPQTGELWASVNERDGLGDDLVPDYVTVLRWRLLWLALVLHWTESDPTHEGDIPNFGIKSLSRTC